MNGPIPGVGGGAGTRAALAQVAAVLTADPVLPDADDMLVVALWPDDERRTVVASPGNSAIRAAVSVAVAAGNVRAWAHLDEPGAPDVTDVAVAALPEIIRASVAPTGLRSIEVAAVRVGDAVACYTMWLSPSDAVPAASRERHRTILDQLHAAATTDLDRATAAASAAAAAHGGPTGDAEADRTPGGADALHDADQLRDALESLTCDRAAVLVLGIDRADTIATEHGDDAVRRLRDATADQLTASVRRHDLVAHLGDGTFAVVLVDVDRHTAFEISHRLRDAVTPAVSDRDVPHASVSIGLAHEDGLFDADEMLEAATGAMRDARAEGGARMLIAC